MYSLGADRLLGARMDNYRDHTSGMAKAVWAIAAAAKANDEVAVVCVPCNTFHAPPVWKAYVEHLKALGADGTTLRLIHMLDETVKMIKEAVPDCKKIGLMSTTGTRESGVYRSLLEPQGYEVVEVPAEQQVEVHETIYNQEWGIKAVSPITLKAVQNFRSYAAVLKQMGAEAIILGCTEIPLALPEPDYEGVPLIDPVRMPVCSHVVRGRSLDTFVVCYCHMLWRNMSADLLHFLQVEAHPTRPPGWYDPETPPSRLTE